ncbi:MAG: response regulator, partial [Myxococcales bacterium]|nr:response regulator [Myxococcales bacterium]
NAEAALACFDDQQWSLVVTDVRMPGIDGIELLALLKERSPGTPVLVMTGYADRDTVARAHDSGALAVVNKPLNLDDFIELVERLAEADVASLGMPRARGAAVRALATAAAADPHLFDPHGAVERLRKIPGIGDWTAQYIAMRAARDADAFPASDVGLQRALQSERGRPTARELSAKAEAWRPWRAYAALHLWAADQENS